MQLGGLRPGPSIARSQKTPNAVDHPGGIPPFWRSPPKRNGGHHPNQTFPELLPLFSFLLLWGSLFPLTRPKNTYIYIYLLGSEFQVRHACFCEALRPVGPCAGGQPPGNSGPERLLGAAVFVSARHRLLLKGAKAFGLCQPFLRGTFGSTL